MSKFTITKRTEVPAGRLTAETLVRRGHWVFASMRDTGAEVQGGFFEAFGMPHLAKHTT